MWTDSQNPHPDCPICSQLKDVESSFFKFAAPETDRPLPEAAGQLVRVATADTREPDKQHMRCCPVCGTLYDYQFSYEYLVNGSEDEETLTRLTPAQATTYLRSQARQLEELRQDTDAAECAAGYLGDYLDHGCPSPTEQQAARQEMDEQHERAAHLRQQLHNQVAALRQSCPAVLTIWAAAHMRVCQAFRDQIPQSGPNAYTSPDASTARYVAASSLAAWEALPQAGVSFISSSAVWMENYLDRLEEELDREDPALLD